MRPRRRSGQQQQERIEDEIGDLLFAVVNLARKCKIDAETALQSATDKFVARFNRLEDELKTRGRKLGEVELAEMDAIWDENQEMKNARMRTKHNGETCSLFGFVVRSSVGLRHSTFVIYRSYFASR